MCISALCHLGLIQNLIFQCQINSCILFRRRSSTCNKNLIRAECNRCRALKEFVASVIRKLLDGPLILVDIITETDFRINIITEQIDVSLISRTSIKRREFEESFLDRSIIINMNGILEHVVHKVWIGLYKFIQSWKDLQILSLLLMEEIESDFILIKLHLVDRLLEVVSLVVNHLFSFLDLLLFLLELLNFFINLLLHHLK